MNVAKDSAPDQRIPGKRVRTKTYSIGLILVGVVILLQLGALVSVFLLRRAVHIDMDAPVLSSSIPAEPVTPAELSSDSNHPQDNRVIAPNPDSTQAASEPNVVPNNSQAPNGSTSSGILQPDTRNSRLTLKNLDPRERIAALNKEADKFRNEGDLDLAQAALLEAENIDSNNSDTLYHQAVLAEQMKDKHRAFIYWQRLFALGPQIGEIYAEAETKLRAMTPPAIPSPPPVNPSTQILAAGPIDQTPILDNELYYAFNLRIPITLKDTSKVIRPSDISIKLFFYDLTDAGQIISTHARRTVGFADGNPTWTTNKTEVLEASYRLTRTPGDVRSYGYLFRLYYSGVLQDEQAFPRKLLTIFPSSPPATVP